MFSWQPDSKAPATYWFSRHVWLVNWVDVGSILHPTPIQWSHITHIRQHSIIVHLYTCPVCELIVMQLCLLKRACHSILRSVCKDRSAQWTTQYRVTLTGQLLSVVHESFTVCIHVHTSMCHWKFIEILNVLRLTLCVRGPWNEDTSITFAALNELPEMRIQDNLYCAQCNWRHLNKQAALCCGQWISMNWRHLNKQAALCCPQRNEDTSDKQDILCMNQVSFPLPNAAQVSKPTWTLSKRVVVPLYTYMYLYNENSMHVGALRACRSTPYAFDVFGGGSMYWQYPTPSYPICRNIYPSFPPPLPTYSFSTVGMLLSIC